MKNQSAARVRGRKRFAQSKRIHKARIKTKRPAQSVKELHGHEIISTNSTLSKVGKKVEYNDGFRLGPGSVQYKEMSATVADMAERVGKSLRRPGKKKTAQLLLGLPDGEYLGFHYPAYKHDKRLPSVALIDTTQTAANITYHFETKILGRAQFAALTFPALDGRITIENYEAGFDLAFKRLNKLKQAFKKSGIGEFIYVQLETPFDPETQTFYLHFHVFLTIGFGDSGRRHALAFFKSNTPWLESQAGLYLKRIANKDVENAIRYGTKPSTTAYEIAKADNEEVFEAFLGKSHRKRFTRTEGPLKATLKQLKEQGYKTTFHRCEATGSTSVCLVEKKSKKDATEKTENEESEPEEVSVSPTPKRTENIYCGCGRPVASPEGRLLAFGLIQNFDEDQMTDLFVVGGPGSFFEANRIARNAWERNTGKRFDLKEFLKPIADDILKLVKGAEVQSYTVIVSQNILNTLLEIEKEQNQKANPKQKTSKNEKEEQESTKPQPWWQSLLVSLSTKLRISSLKTYGNQLRAKVKSFIFKLNS